jgi:hypothetical protein
LLYVTTNAWGPTEVLVAAVPPATQLATLRQLIAVRCASVAPAGAGILTARHVVDRAKVMCGVEPGEMLLDGVDVAHPIVTSANPQLSPTARNARRCVAILRISALDHISGPSHHSKS